MIKRLLAVLIAVLLASPALAQIPGGSNIVINQTPVTGGTPTDCLVVTASGKVGQTNCPAGGSSFATVTGSLIPGNVAQVTATGIADSGVVLITSIPAMTVRGNNSASTAAPTSLAVLTLGNGLVGAPTYSFNASPTTGMYSSGADIIDFAIAGQKAFQIRQATGTNWLEFLSNTIPLLRAQGGTNSPLQLMANGTGEVTIGSNAGGTNPVIGRFTPSGAASDANNYIRFTTAATGNGPIISPLAQGTGDTSIDIVLSPLLNGLLKFGTATSFTANGAIATALTSVGPTGSHPAVQEWLTVKNSSGVTRYIPAF